MESPYAFIKALVSSVFIGILVASSSATLFAQKTSEGTDFWLGFMMNDSTKWSRPEYTVTISSKDNASGQISMPLKNWSMPFTVEANHTVQVVIPRDSVTFYSSEVISGRGIHVTSDAPVNVNFLNYQNYTTDGSIVLPSSSVGYNYIITDYVPLFYSEFLIVANEDNTAITINPTANLESGFPAGGELNIMLNQGQVYQVKSINSLTGTLVTSGNRKNFSLFAGNSCTFVPPDRGTCNHLVEQMYPTESWGKTFVTVPLATKTRGDVYRIVALDDNTNVFINGVFFANIASRQYKDTIIVGASKITSDKPISVALFCTSKGYDGNYSSDPFMVMINPVRQKRKDITFHAYQKLTITNSYLNVVVPSSEASKITLNDSSLFRYFTPLAIDTSYSTATVQVPSGANRIQTTSDSGFFAYAYGFGTADSYGYVVGVNLNPFTISIDPVPCGSHEFHFHVNSTPSAIAEYFWDFGDGGTSSASDPVHVYGIARDYLVKLRVLFADGNIDSTEYKLQFAKVHAEFNKSNLPCDLAAVDFFDNSTVISDAIELVEWDFGDGATATGLHAQHVYTATGDYTVRHRVTTFSGCVDSSSQTLRVRNFPQITEIHGPTRVFSGEVYEYSVPTSQYNENTWQVTGGFILRTTDSSAFIRWDFASGGVVKVTQINKESLCTKSLELGVGIAQWPNPFAGQMGDLFACEHSTETYFTITNDKFHYDWTIEGGVLHQINYRFIEVLWGEPGIGKIIVKMTDTATNSIHIDTVLVTIFPKPQAEIYGPSFVCQGTDEIYSVADPDLECWWAVEKGSILSQTNDMCDVLWPAADTGLVTLIVRNRISHCIDTAWLRVVIHPIPPRPTISRSGDTLSSSAEYGNHWFRKGMFMGDTTRVITPTLQDSISVRVISDFGCQSEMSDMIYFYNEAESEPLASSASIYPNPVEDELFVRINSTDGGRISIVDMLGTEVANVSFGPSDGSPTRSIRIGTQGIASGVYFLRLEIGGRTQYLRFTKQ